jgi:hypothetical protein
VDCLGTRKTSVSQKFQLLKSTKIPMTIAELPEAWHFDHEV